MKKMKKLVAMLLALAMVLGMSMTTFAAGTGKITVKGLDDTETTTVKIYQVLSHDAAGSNWAVAPWAEGKVDITTNPVTVDWAELAKVAPATETDSTTTTNGVAEFTGLEIGTYLVLATGSEVAYSPMGASVYEYNETTKLLQASSETVWAKYSDMPLDKVLNAEESKGTDEFVGRGEEVKFDITTIFPSFYDKVTGEATSGTFWIKDVPVKGLDLSTDVVVKVGNSTVAAANYDVAKDTETGVVTVTFKSSYIGTSNDQAGKEVVVTVTATVTNDDGYVNTANSSNSDNEPEVKGYTGDITLTKYNEDESKVLTGAEFTVEKYDDAAKAYGEAIEFVKVSDGVYTLAKADDEATTTNLVATNGTLQVKGLDEGKYHFTETKAPEGYSINTDGAEVTLEENGTSNVSLTTKVLDTKLVALPATGGIGTAIFTFGGCAIMIAAAFLFFANKRREEA